MDQEGTQREVDDIENAEGNEDDVGTKNGLA